MIAPNCAAPDVVQAHWVRISNVWFVRDAESRWFLIDTGHRTERRALRRSLRTLGLDRRGSLTAILLTHRHCDHAGNAAWLRDRLGCPVICHEHDAAILEGRRQAPSLLARRPGWFNRPLCWIEDTFPARCTVDETFTEGEWRWGFTVVPAFGHTEGSVLLHHEPSQALFSGDAILTGIPPLRRIERLGLAVPTYSLDVDACHQRVIRYLQGGLPPLGRLCGGHGPMVTQDVEGKLRRLAAAPTVAFAP